MFLFSYFLVVWIAVPEPLSEHPQIVSNLSTDGLPIKNPCTFQNQSSSVYTLFIVLVYCIFEGLKLPIGFNRKPNLYRHWSDLRPNVKLVSAEHRESLSKFYLMAVIICTAVSLGLNDVRRARLQIGFSPELTFAMLPLISPCSMDMN